MQEQVIQTRQCAQCQFSFPITERDQEFYAKVSPVFDGKRFPFPDPTLCPDCRHQRRLGFRNERKLYHRKCDKSGKMVISMFSPDPVASYGAGKKYTVYSPTKWYADTRDALDYGRIYDEQQSFFAQCDALLKDVPQIAMIGVGNENCEYNNFGGLNKNCYLCFDYGWNEDCSYLARSYKNKNCLDLSYCAECEISSNLSDCTGCVKCNFAKDLNKCYDCFFCTACDGCNNCFLCSNLVNKQYHIFNIPYSKEEYERKIQDYKSKPLTEVYSEFLSLLEKSLHKYANITMCENVTGDYLTRCKNCREVYGARDTADCTYVIEPMIVDNIHSDIFSGNHCSFNLETIGCESLSHSKFCFSCWSGSSNLLYCHFCHSSHHCFACAGLRNKEYCIFNKQYTKEAYEKEVARIITSMITQGEWGAFFPITLSPFAYNESLAQEYFPLTKERVLKNGRQWMDKEYAVTVPTGTSLLQAKDLPAISEVTDNILQQAIICEVSDRPFRIIQSELAYYRTYGIALPTKHPDQRHAERMALRNPRTLRDRKCMKCETDIKTSYAPERKEIVYCENCYNKEVYG